MHAYTCMVFALPLFSGREQKNAKPTVQNNIIPTRRCSSHKESSYHVTKSHVHLILSVLTFLHTFVWSPPIENSILCYTARVNAICLDNVYVMSNYRSWY